MLRWLDSLPWFSVIGKEIGDVASLDELFNGHFQSEAVFSVVPVVPVEPVVFFPVPFLEQSTTLAELSKGRKASTLVSRNWLFPSSRLPRDFDRISRPTQSSSLQISHYDGSPVGQRPQADS